MKSLTLHNIDEPLLALVKEKAKAQKMSINQFLKDLIEKSIGYKKPETARYIDDYKDVCGVWTVEEKDAFEKRNSDFEQINRDDWQ